MNTSLSKRVVPVGPGFNYIYDVNYIDAFGQNKTTNVIFRLDGDARVSYTATSDITSKVATVIATNPLKVFPDFVGNLKLIDPLNIWDKVLIFEKHKVSNISELEWCICKRNPLFITLISINVEILQDGKIVGRARIDPYTGEIGYN